MVVYGLLHTHFLPLPAEEGLPRPGDKYFGCWLNFRAHQCCRAARLEERSSVLEVARMLCSVLAQHCLDAISVLRTGSRHCRGEFCGTSQWR